MTVVTVIKYVELEWIRKSQFALCFALHFCNSGKGPEVCSGTAQQVKHRPQHPSLLMGSSPCVAVASSAPHKCYSHFTGSHAEVFSLSKD